MPSTTRPHGSNFKPKWDIFSIKTGKEEESYFFLDGWEKAREGACVRTASLAFWKWACDCLVPLIKGLPVRTDLFGAEAEQSAPR